MLYPLTFGGKSGTAIEFVYRAVESLVGLAEILWHEVGVVEVGQC